MHSHNELSGKPGAIHCWGSDFSHLYRAVQIAARHASRIPWREMIGATYSLDQANEALRAVEKREVTKAVIKPG